MLETIVKKRFLSSFEGTSLKICIHCLTKKTHKVTFKSVSTFRKSHILNLIHTDVCMMQSKSIGGALYFVTFIDDCSRKVWPFTLKSKDQVFDTFNSFHAYVKRGT